jgi:hypothetical protein
MSKGKKNAGVVSDPEVQKFGHVGNDSRIISWWGQLLLFHMLYLILPLLGLIVPILVVVFATGLLQIAAVINLVGFWTYMLTDTRYKRLGRPWRFFTENVVFKLVMSWFPVRIMRTKRLDSSKTYVFGCHPHGTMAFNRAAVGFCTDELWFAAFPGVDFRVLMASAAFLIPVIREVFVWSHGVDASKKTAQIVLRASKSVFVYPGGEREQMATERGKHKAFLSSRKGFVKLAIEEGASLVPVYAFGEVELYNHSNFMLSFRQMLVKRFQVAVPLLYGQCGLLPYRVPITLVFGTPIPLPHVQAPSHELVDLHHAQYVQALLKLFDEHKKQMGCPDATLEIL